MAERERSYWSPRLVDRTLREWERWRSLAEGVGSSVPDAHRHGEGHRYDPLTHADRCADVDRAVVACLRQWSVGWVTVDYVRQGYSLVRIAGALQLRSDVVRGAYDEACKSMAIFLGWDSEDPE